MTRMDNKNLAFLSIFCSLLFVTHVSCCPETIAAVCQCVDETDGVLLNCTESDAGELIQLLKASQARLGLIKWLILERTPIQHLPDNYFSGLYIKRLDLIGNGMQSIGDDAFSGLGSTLQELHITKNNLTRIPVAALHKLNALLRMDLSENNFHSLDEVDALPSLSKLYDVNLAYNQIVTVHKTFFEANKNNLQTINMGHNKMKTVPASALRGFRKLMALHLHNNKFSELPKLSFMNLPVLSLLNLAANRIEVIDRQAMLNVPSLRYLYLTDNRLKTILPYQFNFFEQLEMVDLSNNAVAELPAHAFSSLPAIRQIYLADNKISKIADFAFSNSSTVILILEGNKLEEITPQMFDGLFAMQQLSLKDNQIKIVDPNAFRNATALMMIDLSKNLLIDLAPSTFLGQLNMLLVDLSNNRLIRTPYSAFSQRVSTVLLQENPLVCNEKVHMLQQGLGVYVPNSDDRICAGQKSIAATVAKESPNGSGFKMESTEQNEDILAGLNPLQLGQQTAANPVGTASMPKNAINIKSIQPNTGSSIIRPVNDNSQSAVPERPTGQPSANDKNSQKPETNSTGPLDLPYPDDLDHPDNHPGRYYPLPVPYLKTPPKMHPAYTVTQTLPPSIVISEHDQEATKNKVDLITSNEKIEKFEEPNRSVFDETNGVTEGERRAYELDDQQTAKRASQQMPTSLIVICIGTVAVVMIAVFVGLCVARHRNRRFTGSSSSTTTARSNVQFATQMNQMYGTLPHQRTGTLPRQCAQEDIYNWLYGHGGYNAYSKA